MATAVTNITWPLYIGGDWIASTSLAEIRLPYDGTVSARVHTATPDLVRRAITAALSAARSMRAMPPTDRASLLFRIHDILRDQLQDVAGAIALESGKPVKEGRTEAGRALQTLFDSAIEARLLAPESAPSRIAFREPRGVIAVITPFSAPFQLAISKVAPALAAGNAIVHKPAGQTPVTALLLAGAIEKAGAPKGAYNVVWGGGPPLARAIVEDPAVAAAAFSGSLAAGQAVRAAAGLKKVILELGGNSAVIVEPDAHLDSAVPRCLAGAFSHSGQACCAVQRIFLHEDIAGAFIARFADAAAKLKVAHPLEEGSDISSLVSESAAARVEDWIDEARAGGARQILGGQRKHATIPATILENVPGDCRLSRHEVFGPVVSLHRYNHLDDAIGHINSAAPVLEASIFTSGLDSALHAGRSLELSAVTVNDVPGYQRPLRPVLEEMTIPKQIRWLS